MTEHTINRFEWISKILLYVIAVFLPIWFVPLPIGVEFGREATFGILALAAAIFWFLGILTTGSVRLQYSVILFTGLLVVLVFGVSTIFSRAPYVSFLFTDAMAESFATIFMGFLLFILAGSVLRDRKDAEMAVFFMVIAGALGALANAVALIFNVASYHYLVPFIERAAFNPIGTMNAAALFYSVLIAAVLCLFMARRGRLATFVLSAATVIFVLNLILINFWNAWVTVLGITILLLGVNIKDMRLNSWKLGGSYLASGLVMALAVIMLIHSTPVIKIIDLPLEVSPSFNATLQVAQALFREGPRAVLFGSGPATFELDWPRYRDVSINQTPFWDTRFIQGSSWFSTSLATTGILGVFAFLLFLGTALVMSLKYLLPGEKKKNISAANIILFIAFLFVIFLYPATISSVLGIFFAIGLMMRAVSSPAAISSDAVLPSAAVAAPEQAGFWGISERIIQFSSPWVVFLSSLLVIFLLALSVAGIYLETVRIRAASLVQQGVAAFNKGNTSDAVEKLVAATQLQARDYRMYQNLVSARIEQIRGLIQRAAGGANVQQDFQSTIAIAVQESQRMVDLYPANPLLWRTQGALYELLILFIPGSERLAFDSYRRAAELDPLNPAIYTDGGRARISFADRLAALINQGVPERDKLTKIRTGALEEAIQVLTRAIDAKGDFASAHYLIAQAALRQGNIDRAIKSVESTKLVAPFDIGVAFQLGLLYYQTNNMDRARQEFERAIGINANYSNARYFLGLIYDKQGDKKKAIEQFVAIEQFNQDNQEVKKILVNLRAGHAALQGIVPPLEPPEKRKEAPVKQEGKR